MFFFYATNSVTMKTRLSPLKRQWAKRKDR